MEEETKNVLITFFICLTIVLILLISIGGYIYHQITESPHEKCIEECTYAIVADNLELECIQSCNEAVEKIIEDLTDSIDKLDWEEILKSKR